jgi:hypothetical protein
MSEAHKINIILTIHKIITSISSLYTKFHWIYNHLCVASAYFDPHKIKKKCEKKTYKVAIFILCRCRFELFFVK